MLLFAAMIPLYPATVSFLVIETGLPKESPASQYATLWENCLMDVFFESGYIVSNAPILRLMEEPGNGLPSLAEAEFENAKNGGMDYFLVAVVKHPSPYEVSLRLFSTASKEMQQEHNFLENSRIAGSEEKEVIKNSIRAFAKNME